MDPLGEVRRSAQKQREWTGRRNSAIREAVAAGHPYRTVAEAAEMSHTAVANISKQSRSHDDD